MAPPFLPLLKHLIMALLHIYLHCGVQVLVTDRRCKEDNLRMSSIEDLNVEHVFLSFVRNEQGKLIYLLLVKPAIK